MPLLRCAHHRSPVGLDMYGLSRQFREDANRGNMKLISLTQGKFAVVDDEDFGRVCQHFWRAVKRYRCWYAHNIVVGYLHRFVLGVEGRTHVDHKDRNGLDCRRSNLRLATQSQNMANAAKQAKATSKYKGVYKHSQRSGWVAQIRHNHVVTTKWFKTEKEAARQYDIWSESFFGEFARHNDLV